MLRIAKQQIFMVTRMVEIEIISNKINVQRNGTILLAALCKVVLGGITFLLPVYGMANLERYSVFHGI